jgi:hypothetical protein
LSAALELACRLCESDELRVANGPAGANVIEIVIVRVMELLLYPPPLRTLHSRFCDGIAAALTDRLKRKMDYMREEQRILIELFHQPDLRNLQPVRAADTPEGHLQSSFQVRQAFAATVRIVDDSLRLPPLTVLAIRSAPKLYRSHWRVDS